MLVSARGIALLSYFFVVFISRYLLKLITVFNFVIFGIFNIIAFFLVLKRVAATKRKTLKESETMFTAKKNKLK